MADATAEQKEQKKMRVAFIHPDLGIGGAERLVVDAAVGLKNRGHHVTMFTAHHDHSHCFKETIDGTLQVHVYGDFLPRTLFGRFYAFFAYLRMMYTALAMVLVGGGFDVIVCDQISACIPILRLTGCKIVFYCHFPDMLLTQRKSLLKRLYRAPLDWLEEATTGMADVVLVNSRFTASVFRATFTRLAARNIQPGVVYPALNLAEYDSEKPAPSPFADSDIIMLSINRFERKKAIHLAIQAMALLKEKKMLSDNILGKLKLVVAGGYDELCTENKEHFAELLNMATSSSLSVSHYPDTAGQVVFLRSFTNEQRTTLLSRCCLLVYTPANEHFGIVPLEAMYARKPVIAANSGGPLESVGTDRRFGILCGPEPDSFAEAMRTLLSDTELATRMGQSGRKHVGDNFSLDSFSHRLDAIVSEPVRRKRARSTCMRVISGGLVVAMVVIGYLLYAGSLKRPF